MRKLLIFIAVGSYLIASASNRPEAIPSKLLEVKASSWYMEKFRGWMEYLTANPDDKAGWVECFKAAQYGGVTNVELSKIADQLDERFPGSSEAYWTRAKTLGWTNEGVRALQSSLANQPKTDALVDRIMLAEYLGADRAEISGRLNSSNMIYPSLLNYSYNVLMSVGQDGYLFIEGENTTIPIWILQDEMGIRKDVKVLNLNLLENEVYRNRTLAAMNLTFSGNDLATLPLSNADKQFYYALTLPQSRFELIEDQLYVVGLTSLLSSKVIDNYSLLRDNIERKFLLDYLSVDFNGEPKTATGKSLETNYIVPFFLLMEYYEKIQDSENTTHWKSKIKEIAERSQLAARVNMLLANNNVKKEFVKMDIDVKKLDKNLSKVKDNIYAGSFEVTNGDYEVFVDYLRRNSFDDLLKIAEIDLSKYEDDINLRFHMMYHWTDKKAQNSFKDYPVMDLTHEAAKLYCEWLTAQYNQQNGRKFQKVKFRLPTMNEWKVAALGFADVQTWNFEDIVVKASPGSHLKQKDWKEYRVGDFDDLNYPWYAGDWDVFRNRIMNEKGCYLANIKTPKDLTCEGGITGDGYLITSPAGSYFANNMGLYDVIGNIAEMIDEKGKAMGGSWNHPGKECTIRAVSEYEKAEPSVGFRVFMEVIEE
jgi:formylglycine-generating enzyme required for sulfatase activity